MTVYCPRCGYNVPQTADFYCPKCGMMLLYSDDKTYYDDKTANTVYGTISYNNLSAHRPNEE